MIPDDVYSYRVPKSDGSAYENKFYVTGQSFSQDHGILICVSIYDYDWSLHSEYKQIAKQYPAAQGYYNRSAPAGVNKLYFMQGMSENASFGFKVTGRYTP